MVDTLKTEPLAQRLGKNLAKRRKDLGLTQAMVAEKLNLEPESVSRFERGATLPSLATLEQMAACLDTTIADLLAELPGTAYTDAERISALMADFQPETRKELIDLLERMCRMIRHGGQ